MLKITRTDGADGALLKLEGRLLAPWVAEVQRAAAGAAPLRLDLAGVQFVDGAGEQLLRALLQRGASITACSGYLAELLKERRWYTFTARHVRRRGSVVDRGAG